MICKDKPLFLYLYNLTITKKKYIKHGLNQIEKGDLIDICADYFRSLY